MVIIVFDLSFSSIQVEEIFIGLPGIDKNFSISKYSEMVSKDLYHINILSRPFQHDYINFNKMTILMQNNDVETILKLLLNDKFTFKFVSLITFKGCSLSEPNRGEMTLLKALVNCLFKGSTMNHLPKYMS